MLPEGALDGEWWQLSPTSHFQAAWTAQRMGACQALLMPDGQPEADLPQSRG